MFLWVGVSESDVVLFSVQTSEPDILAKCRMLQSNYLAKDWHGPCMGLTTDR